MDCQSNLVAEKVFTKGTNCQSCLPHSMVCDGVRQADGCGHLRHGERIQRLDHQACDGRTLHSLRIVVRILSHAHLSNRQLP